MKTVLKIICVSVLLGFVFSLFSPMRYLAFLNALFLISLLLLVFSGLLLLHEKGAFRITYLTFKKVISFFHKNGAQGEIERGDQSIHDFLQGTKSKYVSETVIASVILTACSIVLGYLYN